MKEQPIDIRIEELALATGQGSDHARREICVKLEEAFQDSSADLLLWLKAAGELRLRESLPFLRDLLLGRGTSSLEELGVTIVAACRVFRLDDPDIPALIIRLREIADIHQRLTPELARPALLGAVLFDQEGWMDTLIVRLPTWPLRLFAPAFRAGCGWLMGQAGTVVPSKARVDLYDRVTTFEVRARSKVGVSDVEVVRAMALELLAWLAEEPRLAVMLSLLTRIYGLESRPIMRAGAACALRILLERFPEAEGQLRGQGLIGVDAFLSAARNAPNTVYDRAATG